MDTIQRFVQFVCKTKYDDIPADAIAAAKMLLTDIIATTVCGTTSDGTREAVSLLMDWGGKEESTVLVYDKKLPVYHAAFLNSLLSHARDYDEVQEDAIVHTGVSVIPTALAVAEAVGNVSGKKLLASIVLTDELFIRMGLSIKTSIMQSGWIYSALCGHFACALCSSLLLGLSEEQTVNALGLVYSQAAGNQQCATDTSLAKRMQPAFAARSGVFSAYLAKSGLTGAQNIFDGDYSFYKVYIKDQCDKSILTEDLGKKYWIPTLSYKPYPVCGLGLSAADGVRKIMHDHNVKMEEITGFDIGMTKQTHALLVEPKEVKYNPNRIVDAQFSIPFAVAMMAARGHLYLSDLTEQGLQDPVMRGLLNRVQVHIDEELEAKFARGVPPSRVTIHTARGSFTECVFHKGNPENPFTAEDMRGKYMDAMKFGMYPTKPGAPEKILEMIDQLEDMEDITLFIREINSAFVR